jgi:dihydrodipicolinate synthase/N-acetylneuraminate lyase
MQSGTEVSDIQARVDRQRHLLEKYTPYPPALKALLHRQHGFPRWSVRPPLVEMSSDMEESLIRDFMQ